jgi:hypothetical protein
MNPSANLTVEPLTLDRLHAGFLSILERIQLHARIFFRHINCPHRKEDAIAETVALAWKWYLLLAHKGKDARQFPSALAAFTARAVKSGRRLCGQERVADALSPLAQARHGFAVSSLPSHSTLSANLFSEALADNTRTPVPEQVHFRIDFPAWLRRLGDRDRRIARDMALGHRTQDLARLHQVSAGRISQLRRQLHTDWLHFLGEDRPSGQPRLGLA